MDPEQVTMYMEIGARAYSDLSAEDSGVATSVIKYRGMRAGYDLPVRPKAILPKGQSAFTVGAHYVATLPLKGNSQAVVTVVCDGATKNNNMHATVAYGYGTGKYRTGKKLVVLRKNVLCAAKGDWDD